MLKPLFLITFIAATFGQVLCPGNGAAIEKDGILAALQQIGKIVSQADAGSKLVSVDLLSYGPCQYEMLSLDGAKRLIFIIGPVPMQLSSSIAAAGGATDLSAFDSALLSSKRKSRRYRST